MKKIRKPSKMELIRYDFHQRVKDLSTLDLRTQLSMTDATKAKVESTIKRLRNETAGEVAAHRVLAMQREVLSCLLDGRR